MRLIDADNLEECKEVMTTIHGECKYAVRMDDIRKMPTITVDRPHGEWENCGGIFCARCSVCKEIIYEYCGNFCPNCGASMVQKEGDEK